MRYFISILGIFMSVLLWAQMYEPLRCSDNSQEIRKLLKNGKNTDFSLFDAYGGAYCAWATSYLKASGTPPVKPKGSPESASSDADYEAWADYYQKLDNWQYMYGPKSAFDGDIKTAWCEGAQGNGTGEVLIVPIDISKPVVIRGGYCKNDDLYKKNARPAQVQVYLLGARRGDAGQYGTVYTDFRVLSSLKTVLADKNGSQPLPIPEPMGGEYRAYFIALEILTVYPGSKWQDTCISEIANR